MGRTVCEAVLDDPDLELVAAVDPNLTEVSVGELIGRPDVGLTISGKMSAVTEATASVAVDFTHAEAARQNLAWLAAHGVHAVVGTTGLSDADYDQVAVDFSASNCIVAPNFAISAVLMMRFAELAAPFFDAVEVIELHHESKVDAPSGTAVATVERIAGASDQWLPDPTTQQTIEGARGGSRHGIHVHSVRLRGLVAHQEVIFGAAGQSLTLRQDSYDRTSFMPGVILAVKAVGDRRGLTIGLDSLLES
jgi:4-hydroxy-tetrahydrodipicolinate reductase